MLSHKETAALMNLFMPDVGIVFIGFYCLKVEESLSSLQN